MSTYRSLLLVLFIACAGCNRTQSTQEASLEGMISPTSAIPSIQTASPSQTISPSRNPSPTHTPSPEPVSSPTLTATSSALPWSALDENAQWAAFVDFNQDLYLAYEDGNQPIFLAGEIFLTAPYLGDTCPKWSPDGMRIAFSTSPKNLTVKDLRDSSSLSIAMDKDLFSYSWHPNGKMLAVIYQGGVKLLDASNGNELAYAPGRWATFSPDGSRLAILLMHTSSKTGDIYFYELLLDPTTGLAGRFNPPQTRTLYISYLRDLLYSPDGQSVIFVGSFFEGKTHLFSLKLTEETQQYLYPEDISAMQIAWSPTGKQLAFIGATQPDQGSASPLHAFVVRGAGGGLMDLSDADERYTVCPSWSADGSRLFYATIPDLYRINADGSDRQVVRFGEGKLSAGIYRPVVGGIP